MSDTKTWSGHRVSSATVERLAVLLEECGEIVHIAGKTLRHGLESSHADYGFMLNRDLLAKEVGDVLAAIDVLLVFELELADVQAAKRAKFDRLAQFFHHPENRKTARELCRRVANDNDT